MGNEGLTNSQVAWHVTILALKLGAKNVFVRMSVINDYTQLDCALKRMNIFPLFTLAGLKCRRQPACGKHIYSQTK